MVGHLLQRAAQEMRADGRTGAIPSRLSKNGFGMGITLRRDSREIACEEMAVRGQPPPTLINVIPGWPRGLGPE